jgi:SpoVK/Ycf46/Vps4 family AAA+-type ATPase
MKTEKWYETLDTLINNKVIPTEMHRTLLFGPPGTGKSTYGFNKHPNCERIAITEGTAIEELIGMWTLQSGEVFKPKIETPIMDMDTTTTHKETNLELRRILINIKNELKTIRKSETPDLVRKRILLDQRIIINKKLNPEPVTTTEPIAETKPEENNQNKGSRTVFIDGAATRAMREGKLLILDEIDRHSPEVESVLHAILDDRKIASLQLPTGEIVRPKEGFQVIATTNSEPECLGEALLDRFEIILHAKEPINGITDEFKAPLKKLVENHYNKIPAKQFSPPISVRRAKAYQKLTRILSPERSAEIVFGSRSSEFISCLASNV